jgi:branched-chain amino acid transport system ATP-binding protein
MRLGILGRSDDSGTSDDLKWVHGLFPIVEQFADRPAGQLSGGQQQQLAIARALVSNPKLLLLDEPSLGLAPIVVDEMFSALQQVRERGVSILIVEQRAERTVAFADRTQVMRNGEVVMSVGVGESATPEQLAVGYFGHE